ncbi:MAG: ferritin [Deltaproteobacteria bacterium]|jgi:ferritin|nr:ferritin [Deltaproteobacteria bacterium]MCK5011528.1 ferritin [Deltaproteobacteria bacterium]NOQ85612.1 ferritin [Deltaproteobacteria bacterium]
MIKEKIQDALNEQINAELYSSYLYLSMSAYFESINLKGFASWMRVQTQEELVHAMKFYDYLIERGGKVVLSSIESPPTEWPSPLAIFENAYQHEQKVTGLINELVDLAIAEKDHATNIILQWFVSEQVEEEASADEVVQKIKLMGDARGGIFMLDRELAQRVFTPPTATQ